jgi:hypothetical protein
MVLVLPGGGHFPAPSSGIAPGRVLRVDRVNATREVTLEGVS